MSTSSSLVALSTELSDLKAKVKQLHRDNKDQLSLEYETQATLENLSDQIRALRRSFALLADVTMQEMDELRGWVRRRNEEADRRVEDALAGFVGMKQEIASLRSTIGSLQEQAQTHGVKHAEVVAELMRADELLLEELRESKKAHASTYTATLTEIAEAKKHADQQAQGLRATLAEVDNTLSRFKLDLKKVQSQRVGDLDVMEQTISRHTQQQAKHLQGADDVAHRVSSEVGGLKARLEAIEGTLSDFHVDLIDTRDRMRMQQQDANQKYEYLKNMVKAFGEALGLRERAGGPSPPPPPSSSYNA